MARSNFKCRKCRRKTNADSSYPLEKARADKRLCVECAYRDEVDVLTVKVAELSKRLEALEASLTKN